MSFPTVTVGGVDVSSLVDWERTEVNGTLPGMNSATIGLLDVGCVLSFGDRAVVVVNDGTSKLPFQGELERTEEDYTDGLEVDGSPTRELTLHCIGLDFWFDKKIVGAPDGSLFTQLDGKWTPVDPSAQIAGGTDSGVVAGLVATYLGGVDTSTYVETFRGSIGSPDPVYFTKTNLRSAINDAAALTSPWSEWWLDDDWKLHWTSNVGTYANPPVIGQPTPPPHIYVASPTLDTNGMGLGVAGLDTIAGVILQGLHRDRDATGWADSLYANGESDITTRDGYTIDFGGSGWVNGTRGGREAYIDLASANTVGERDSMGGAALTNARRAINRWTCNVWGYLGWRRGQWVTVNSARAGLSGAQFMLRSVKLTWLGDGTPLAALGFGDAPMGTIGLRRSVTNKKPFASAATHVLSVEVLAPTGGAARIAQLQAAHLVLQHDIAVNIAAGKLDKAAIDQATDDRQQAELALLIANKRRVQTQYADAAGVAVKAQGKTVNWTLTVLDPEGLDITASAGASLSAASSITDVNGQAIVDVTLSTTKGYYYFVEADTP